MSEFDLVGSLLVIGVAVLGAYVLLLAIVSVVGPLSRLGSYVAAEFVAPLLTLFDRLDRRRRFQRLEVEVGSALGKDDEWGDRERADIVNAAVAAQRIDVLNQMLRKSCKSCLSTHWAVAQGMGAVHMSQAARHPLCSHQRQRVIDLSELLSDSLASYPLLVDSSELIQLHLGLRWIPAACIACPYWSAERTAAPRVCPTVKALCGDARSESTIVEGEVVQGSSR